jgi:hypothetical protein
LKIATLGMRTNRARMRVMTAFTSTNLALDGPSVSRHALVEYNAFFGLLSWLRRPVVLLLMLIAFPFPALRCLQLLFLAPAAAELEVTTVHSPSSSDFILPTSTVFLLVQPAKDHTFPFQCTLYDEYGVKCVPSSTVCGPQPPAGILKNWVRHFGFEREWRVC